MLERFPWYNPELNTPSLNALKLLQHLRKSAKRSPYPESALATMVSRLTLGRLGRDELQRELGISESMWQKHYLVVPRARSVEVLPAELAKRYDTEALLLALVAAHPAVFRAPGPRQRGAATADMRTLYAPPSSAGPRRPR